MSQINDAIHAAIADNGVADQLNDKLLRFYLANGATSLELQDAELEFLYAQDAGLEFGAERVVEPFFTSEVGWTPGNGWTISGDRARVDGTQVTHSGLVNGGTFNGTGSDKILIDIESVSGQPGFGIEVDDGASVLAGPYTTPGRFRKRAPTAGAGPIVIKAGPGVVAVVKGISVKEITAVNSNARLIQDMWEWYLRTTKGFTGALDDMRLEYWTTGPRP